MHLVTVLSTRHSSGKDRVLQKVKGRLQVPVLVAPEPTGHVHDSEQTAAFREAWGVHFDQLSAGVLCEVLLW
jgi:hypothetical protein